MAAAAVLAEPPWDVDAKEGEGTGGAALVATSPAFRMRGTRFCIRCSSTLTRERISETICIPFERVTRELVEAADGRRRDTGTGAVVEEEASVEGITGMVLLETSGRRGDGAGSREGELVDGEAKVERVRAPARVLRRGGGDRIALRDEGAATAGVGFCSAIRIVSRVGESTSFARSAGCRSLFDGKVTSSSDSEADNAGDATAKASSSSGPGSVGDFANWSRSTEASVAASALSE